MKKILSASALVIASFAVALALGEGTLRAIGFSYFSFWQPDEFTGARLRAGAEGWSRDEGEAYVKINSRGLRDVEHTLAKPQGVYRIAVLGDSYAEAMQVEREETFWARLPAALEHCGLASGKRIETLNFGVSGFGTAQELLTLRERAWAYAPDLVLLAFYPGNDVRNNSKALEPEKTRPFFTLREDRLALDDSFRTDPRFLESMRIDEQRAALQSLRLYQLLRRVRAGTLTVHHNAPIAAALAADADVPALNEPGLDENVLRAPPDPQWSEAWRVTEGLILAMRDEVRGRGARFLVAVLSTPGAVYPDAALRARYQRHLGVDDLFYPERRILALAKREGFDAVVLAPDMQRYAEATGTYLHGFANTRPGFGHWNAAGHALAATLIARHLCTPN
jgi:hypothetical protein